MIFLSLFIYLFFDISVTHFLEMLISRGLVHSTTTTDYDETRVWNKIRYYTADDQLQSNSVSVHTAFHVGSSTVHSLKLLHVLQPVLLRRHSRM